MYKGTPTFGNVLYAIDPLRKTKPKPRAEGLRLPPMEKYFDEEEWAYLIEFHNVANPLQHIQDMPSRLVVPHPLYNPERIHALVLKAGVVSKKSEFRWWTRITSNVNTRTDPAKRVLAIWFPLSHIAYISYTTVCQHFFALCEAYFVQLRCIKELPLLEMFFMLSILYGKQNQNRVLKDYDYLQWRSISTRRSGAYLIEFHNVANPLQHIQDMPSRLVVPHPLYNPERIHALVLKAGVVSEKSEFSVVDQDNESSGSDESDQKVSE